MKVLKNIDMIRVPMESAKVCE